MVVPGRVVLLAALVIVALLTEAARGVLPLLGARRMHPLFVFGLTAEKKNSLIKIARLLIQAACLVSLA